MTLHLSPKIGSPHTAPKIVPNFTEQILGSLLDSSALDKFASEIVEPLATRHDTTHVYNYFHRTLSAQEVDWTIFVPRHRTVVDPTPPEDDLVRVIPRDEFPSSGGWIDNIAENLDHLVSLLTQADDLPRSSPRLDPFLCPKTLRWTSGAWQPRSSHKHYPPQPYLFHLSQRFGYSFWCRRSL